MHSQTVSPFGPTGPMSTPPPVEHSALTGATRSSATRAMRPAARNDRSPAGPHCTNRTIADEKITERAKAKRAEVGPQSPCSPTLITARAGTGQSIRWPCLQVVSLSVEGGHTVEGG